MTSSNNYYIASAIIHYITSVNHTKPFHTIPNQQKLLAYYPPICPTHLPFLSIHPDNLTDSVTLIQWHWFTDSVTMNPHISFSKPFFAQRAVLHFLRCFWSGMTQTCSRAPAFAVIGKEGCPRAGIDQWSCKYLPNIWRAASNSDSDCMGKVQKKTMEKIPTNVRFGLTYTYLRPVKTNTFPFFPIFGGKKSEKGKET